MCQPDGTGRNCQKNNSNRQRTRRIAGTIFFSLYLFASSGKPRKMSKHTIFHQNAMGEHRNQRDTSTMAALPRRFERCPFSARISSIEPIPARTFSCVRSWTLYSWPCALLCAQQAPLVHSIIFLTHIVAVCLSLSLFLTLSGHILHLSQPHGHSYVARLCQKSLRLLLFNACACSSVLRAACQSNMYIIRSPIAFPVLGRPNQISVVQIGNKRTTTIDSRFVQIYVLFYFHIIISIWIFSFHSYSVAATVDHCLVCPQVLIALVLCMYCTYARRTNIYAWPAVNHQTVAYARVLFWAVSWSVNRRFCCLGFWWTKIRFLWRLISPWFTCRDADNL